jgi:hypothetical protein
MLSATVTDEGSRAHAPRVAHGTRQVLDSTSSRWQGAVMAGTRRVFMLLFVGALALVTVACGGDDSSTKADTSSDSSSGDIEQDAIDQAAGVKDAQGGFAKDQCPTLEEFNEVAANPAEDVYITKGQEGYEGIGIVCQYSDPGDGATFASVTHQADEAAAEAKCRKEVTFNPTAVKGVLDGAIKDQDDNRVCAWKGDVTVYLDYLSANQSGSGVELVKLLIEHFDVD